MVLCCVVDCSKRSGRDKVMFFRIPAVITQWGAQERELSERRRRDFLAAIGRADLNGTKLSNARICSLHFVSGSPASLFDDTNVSGDWVPTLKLRSRGPQKASEMDDSEERYKRRSQRAERRFLESSSRRTPKSRLMSSLAGTAKGENIPH